MALLFNVTSGKPIPIKTLQREAENLQQEALGKLSAGTLFPTKSCVTPYVQSQAEALLSCLVGRLTEALYQLRCWTEANESRNIPGTLMSVSKHSDGWWICSLMTDLSALVYEILKNASESR